MSESNAIEITRGFDYDFDVYTVTPTHDDTSLGVNDSIYCPYVPGPSVCMSERDYRDSRSDQLAYRLLKDKCEEKCSNQGYSLGEVALISVGFVLIIEGAISIFAR